MPDFIALLGESPAIVTKLGNIEYCDVVIFAMWYRVPIMFSLYVNLPIIHWCMDAKSEKMSCTKSAVRGAENAFRISQVLRHQAAFHS